MNTELNKLFELEFGSSLYGTRTKNSDKDYKSIYLPTSKQIVLNTYKKTISIHRSKETGEKNTKDDIDIEIFSLDRYCKLLTEGQTVAMDMLFAPIQYFNYIDPELFCIYTHIYNNRDKFLSKDLSAFINYARTQASKYGLKGFRVAAFRDTLEFLSQFDDHSKLIDIKCRFPLEHFVYKDPENSRELNNEYIKITSKFAPHGKTEEFLEVAGKFYALNCIVKTVRTQVQQKFDEYGKRALLAEKNEGVDWKALSHAVRVNSQGVEVLQTGNITFPRPDKELLLKVKTGQLQYKEVEEIILQGFEDLKSAQEKSTLRSKPDLEWVDNYVEQVYTDIVKGNL